MSPGRLRSIVVVFLACMTILAASWPMRAVADDESGVVLKKTVTAATITPNVTLSLSYGTGQADTIPGDPITYTSTLANTGATVGISGQIVQGYHGVVEDSRSAPSATVVAYWDVVSTSAPKEGGCSTAEDGSEDSSDAKWTPLAGQAAKDPTWKVIVPAPISTGMILTATGVPNPKVTFPATGDPFLGTVITNTTAHWNYQVALQLTPAQLSFLLDKKLVCAIRNTFHIEMKPGIAPTTDGSDDRSHSLKPSTSSVKFSSKLVVKGTNGDLRAASITITPPSGSATVFNSGSTPALADVAPGASVTVTLRFPVPLVAPRGALEPEADYLTRLRAADKAALKATATAAGTGSSGPVTVAAPPVTTTEHVPVLGIMKTGPATIDAGATETNPLAISNSGSAPASTLVVADSVPGGAVGTVTGLPATLAPAPSPPVNASAAFAIPIGQPAGPLTDTAALSWADANGNPYGPVSSSFTTAVHNNFFGASLTLTPAVAGPNKPGTTQTLTAKLLDRAGVPMANQPLTFTVTGVNPGTGSASTDANGLATFTYTGNNAGNDVAQAAVNVSGVSLASNTSTISWVLLLQPVAMTPVTGNFFTNTGPSCTFLPGPGTTPVFSQQFPDILFNPAGTQVPHNISGVTPFTTPFTDLTTDVNGNYNGTIVAQDQSGNVAGAGPLANFYSELTGSFVIQQAGDVTLTISHADGYLLGVGGGATRVSGAFEGNPPATTPFNSYPTVAAFNQASAPLSDHDTIHFPAPGVYPFEIDYTQCGHGAMTLVVQLTTFNAQNSPLSIYVGYADGLRGAGSIFPFPWEGSPDVTFVGSGVFDSGALRFDNSGDSPITFDTVTVDVGGAHYDIWPHSLVVPAHKILILAQTNGENFDSSDVNGTGCNQDSGLKPVVHLITGTTTTSFTDTQEILNTHGFDSVCLGNESESWVRIGGGGTPINVPLPPAGTLNLTPFNVPNAIQGQPLALTVAAMDGSGNAVANLPITLQVFGANARNLGANSDATGLAHFTYTGVSGKDTLIATGFVSGLREVSNTGTVVWAPPVGGGPNPNPDPNAPPAPTIGPLSIADGSIVTKPVTVSATVTPPAGQTITSWRVFYIALDPGPLVVIGSGTGAPPAPPAVLATFDPTVLVNDGYSITVEATASNGGIQDATTSVTVLGNLKPGRFTTTFEDLAVPVDGFRMDVRRTYDSFDHSSSDFGPGWRVSVGNFRVAPSRILGAGGWTMYNKQCIFGICFTAYKNSAPRFVTVVFPDQHTEVFDLTPAGGTNLFWDCSIAFTARGAVGTTSTLTPLDDTGCSYSGNGNLYGAGGQPYDPHRFQLKTLDGRSFVLDRTLGLVSESDAHGNTLTVGAGGITSSSGPGVTYTRDAQGRITAITGPGGVRTQYAYDSNGDLLSSTDSDGRVLNYVYASPHQLSGFSGAGAPQQTLSYDTAGRLVAVTDATGHTTNISNDVPGQKQVITQPTGEVFVLTLDDLGDVISQSEIADGKALTSTYTYDAVGHLLTSTDPLGHTYRATYDSNNNLASVTDAAGATSTITYGTSGQPLTISDALGRTTRLAYDSNLNLASITDPLGQVESFTYDGAGNRVSDIDVRGGTTTFSYDSSGNVISQTDQLARTTHSTYDAQGRLTSTTDPLGKITSYSYDNGGHLLSQTDPLGAVYSYGYDLLGQRTSATDPLGHVTTFTYDAIRRLAHRTDPLGGATSFTYDPTGRVLAQTRPDGSVLQSTYDGHGRLATSVDPLGRTIAYAYDDQGRQVAETSPAGGTTTYAYDAGGHRTAVTNPAGATTHYTYDAIGELVSVADPLGATTIYAHDANGRQTSITDPLGHVTSATFDASGNPVTATDPAGGTFTNGYDAAGQRIAQTDPTGRTTTFGYDAAGQLTSTTDPGGHTVVSAYDAAGRVSGVAHPSGAAISYTRDAAGQLLTATDSLGNTTTYTYDAGGRQTGQTDALGHHASFHYDAVGRQTSVVDALGGTVALAYDAAGEQTRVTDPDGHATTFTYTALGRVASQTLPSGASSTNSYDALGNLTAHVSAAGQQTTYSYDGAGRLVGAAFTGGTMSQTYDAAGRRTGFTDPTGSTTFGYDAAGRVTSVAAPAGTLGYGYDAAGRRTSLTLPGGRTTTYAYDAAGLLASVVDWNGATSALTHNADGALSQVSLGNGVTSSYSYDAAGRLIGLAHNHGSTPIVNYQYALDANGNRQSVNTSAGSETYGYDALGRIVSVTYPDGTVATYSYDAAGNRTSSTTGGSTTSYSYDSSGRLVSAGGSALSYDADGNLIGYGAQSFTYDPLGRLAGASSGGGSTGYAYDADGVRVAASSGGSTTSYLVDRVGQLPQVVGTGGVAPTTYIRGESGSLLEQVSAAGVSYPLADGLGSVRRMADAAGNITAGTEYDVFGAARSGTAPAFAFAGQQADPTGLLFLRARYYDPSVGRFLSVDSQVIGAPGTQGYNRYLYAADNPVNLTDPSGQSVLVQQSFLMTLNRIAAVGLRVLGVALLTLLASMAVDCLVLHRGGCAFPGQSAGGTDTGAGSGAAAGADAAAISTQAAAVAAVARAAVAACAASGIISAVVGINSACNALPANILFPGHDAEKSTEHNIAAIASYPEWDFLVRSAGRGSRTWYDDTKDPRCSGRAAGTACDEYPFFTTVEGGQFGVPLPSLLPVPGSEALPQARAISAIYRKCRLVPEDAVSGGFFVEPLPAAPISFSLCKKR